MHTRLRLPLVAATVVAAGWLATLGAQAPDAPDLRLSADRAQALARALREGLDAVPGEVLVKFRPGAGPAQMARALGILRGGVSAPDQRWVGDLLLVRAGDEPDPEQAAARLAAQPEVEFAEPNYIYRTQASVNDTVFGEQWNLGLINVPRAWDINPGGSTEVTVAVLDTGLTMTDRTFQWQLWTGSRFGVFGVPFRANPDMDPGLIDRGEDFVLFAAGQPVLDMNGHGSHVAGTIAQATNNAIGAAGIAYRSRILPLKVCYAYWDLQVLVSASGEPGFVPPILDGVCESATVAEGIRYAADAGAKVLNLSLGGALGSQAQLDAIRYAVGRGAFVVMAAGNDFERGNPTQYPASYAAQIDGAMAVAAVDRNSARAPYSNTGSWVEIAAPGGNTRAGAAAGIWQVTVDRRDSDPETTVVPRFDRFALGSFQGTSMAAPHVAGVAALLYSQGITNPAAIEAALKRFAVDLGPAGRDDEYGAGLIDARAALRGLGIAR